VPFRTTYTTAASCLIPCLLPRLCQPLPHDLSPRRYSAPHSTFPRIPPANHVMIATLVATTTTYHPVHRRGCYSMNTPVPPPGHTHHRMCHANSIPLPRCRRAVRTGACLGVRAWCAWRAAYFSAVCGGSWFNDAQRANAGRTPTAAPYVTALDNSTYRLPGENTLLAGTILPCCSGLA